MKGIKVAICVALGIFLTGCAGNQIRQDQKDNYNLQIQAYIANQTAANAVAAEAVKTCSSDANPGLCVNMALISIKQGTGAIPQAPAPYVSPAGKIFSASLGTLNTALGLWAGYSRDKNIIAMLDTVGRSAGNHVQGDFINGWQDNSDNSDNHVDNSVAVGGNLGDTYGDDYTGGDRATNEFSGSGPVVVDSTDTTIGNNNRNSGNIGTDNRQTSDGPFDNDDNSNDGDDDGDCAGECNESPADPTD